MKEKERQEATMKEVCEKCGHHGFCRFEDSCQEKLESLSKKLSEINTSDAEPFVVLIQCRGFCVAAPEPNADSKEK